MYKKLLIRFAPTLLKKMKYFCKKNTMRSPSIFIVSILLAIASLGQTKRFTREEYFDTYAQLAVEEMKKTGIPASITLAQGSLESENGNSNLAIEANNHFGIKCHKEWTGKTFHKDDDAKDECFRVYDKAEESYIDHSEFLKSRERYAFLFQLPPRDYKGWAHGLKKAGYATNPNYPALLIKIIEDNKLYDYDNGKIIASATKDNGKGKKRPRFNPKDLVAPPKLVDIDTEFEIASPVRQVVSNNNVNYIITKKKDNFESIAKEYNLSTWQIYKFNDLTRDSSIRAREVIYIQPKKGKADKRYLAHIIQANENLQTISQLYGIKLRKLAKRNMMNPKDSLAVGAQLILR